jgi:hypothetical protein
VNTGQEVKIGKVDVIVKSGRGDMLFPMPSVLGAILLLLS